ncbi:hypothetical protein D3C87_1373690 [compost metagenome]
MFPVFCIKLFLSKDVLVLCLNVAEIFKMLTQRFNTQARVIERTQSDVVVFDSFTFRNKQVIYFFCVRI